jgi:hypothetical protein
MKKHNKEESKYSQTGIVFTVAANNYLNYVDVLGRSLKKYNPDMDFVVIIADSLSVEIEYDKINCNKYIFIDEIINDKELLADLSEKYTVTEFCTTIKPDCYLYFANHCGVEKIVYLDPDIKLYSPIIEVFCELETNDVVLTPHVCSPTPDGTDPSDHNLMKTGVFNLGFLAMKINDETRDFLCWWKDKLYKFGQKDIANGYFYDQIWWMLGVCFLDKVKILRHLGYNICNWNLQDRILINDGVQLRFFHFSHFDENMLPMLASYNSTFNLENRLDVKKIYLDYALELNNVFIQYRDLTPHYGQRLNNLKTKNKIKMTKIQRLTLSFYHFKRIFCGFNVVGKI